MYYQAPNLKLKDINFQFFLFPQVPLQSSYNSDLFIPLQNFDRSHQFLSLNLRFLNLLIDTLP